MGFVAGYLLVLSVFLKQDFIKRSLDADVVILLFFSVAYAAFYTQHPEFTVQASVFYLIFPITFFLLGKYFVEKSKSVQELYLLLLMVGFLFSFTPFVSVTLNLIQGGFIQLERNVPMFWDKKIVSTTLMASFFTFNMCILPLLVVQVSQRKKFSKVQLLVAFGVFIVSLLCTFRLGSRTQAAIAMILLVFALLYVIPNQSYKNNFRLFIVILILGAIVYKFVPLNLDADYFSVLGNRLEQSDNTGTAGGRTQRWALSLPNLISKPLGWSIDEFGYSHNLWLDVAQVTGILPFCLLIVFSARNFLNLKKLVRNKTIDLPFRTIILTFTVATNIVFFVEPIMQGAFSLFVIYCFMQGVLNKYLHYEKRQIVVEGAPAKLPLEEVFLDG
jgi:O-antigen ligase